jgi:DNA-binding NarL/FixJ family response regulator
MKSLKVLIADDHALMRKAIRAVLDKAEGIEIVGETGGGEQVLPLVRATQPTVVLLDIRMPGMDGIACLNALTRNYPDVKVIVLTAVDDASAIEEAARLGASGYILKTVDPSDLPSLVRQISDGNVFRSMAGKRSDGSALAAAAGLTPKEAAVLDALTRGLANRAIAKELWLTEQTVKFHLTNIYRKLGVSSRTEATRYAYDHHLVESPLYDKV